ncbi:MAG: AEC family transporter [Oscillatoriales cyanobacterium C42_A2020_001]|nr:AEC family transporter [Leptolyngbyaceae cyanobacterium C42_A2020_001]
MLISKLLTIYTPLIGWTGVGWIAARFLPASIPGYIGKGLFWVGVPIGIVAFLRHAQVSWSLWIAPATAWVAILLGILLAGVWLQRSRWSSQTRISFMLTSMVGNTGYIGFPVSLILVGQQHFAWAVFYDLLGSTLGAYGLGVALAARSHQEEYVWTQTMVTLASNPALWSFWVGLLVRDAPLPGWLETSLRTTAWMMVSLSLILIGMRLSQLRSLKSIQPAAMSLMIKMLLVPLIVGGGLWLAGITGAVHRVLLLQAAMPPAFASLVISEAYERDPEMAVTAIAIGCLGLLGTLPIWLWLSSG